MLMEDYTVQKKDDGSVYYVLEMAEGMDDPILLANVETGQIVIVKGWEAFAAGYVFDAVIDDDEDDDDEEEEEKPHAAPSQQSLSP